MERTFPGEAGFQDFARTFARDLRPGDVVGLSGPLGAGKTTFVKAIVRALHDADPVSSPTFTFWHRYDGTPPIDHIDFYRIEGAEQAAELGIDEAFDGSSIVLVEWWRNAGDFLPRVTWDVTIAGKGGGPRTVSLQRT